jgi:hypothetical protein
MQTVLYRARGASWAKLSARFLKGHVQFRHQRVAASGVRVTVASLLAIKGRADPPHGSVADL